MDNETVICHQCVDEKYVKSVIKAQGTTKHPCSYCGHKRKSMPISTIADLMHQVFDNYYKPERADYYNDMGRVNSAKDVIAHELGVNDNTANDIYQELCKRHNSSYYPDRLIYDDDFVYGYRQFSLHKINQSWENMKSSLNSETRFFNRLVKKFLDDLFSDLDEFRTDKDDSPIKTINADFRLYRARYFESLREVEKELSHPERNFGPPPSHLARSGRMNAHGIAVFYGATSPDIAIAEIRPPVGTHVIVAPFEPRKPLRILDLSTLDRLVSSKQSVFDPETIKSLEKTAFLKTISHTLTLPVFDNQDNGYLITQVIAEYLSVSKKYNLDGISFTSTQVKKKSQNSKQKKDHEYNVVLFSKSSGVMYSGPNERLYKVSMMGNLRANIDHTPFTIQLIEEEQSSLGTRSFPTIRNNDKALELIATDLQYYRIEGILFQKTMKDIKQGEPTKKLSENLPSEEIELF